MTVIILALFLLSSRTTGSNTTKCYQTTMQGSQTLDVQAGTTINFNARAAISHPGSLNVYMAKAPAGTAVSEWDGSGDVWFKVRLDQKGVPVSAQVLTSNSSHRWRTRGPKSRQQG